MWPFLDFLILLTKLFFMKHKFYNTKDSKVREEDNTQIELIEL